MSSDLVDLNHSIDAAIRMLNELANPRYITIDEAIPQDLLRNAKGIAFVQVIKAGLFFLGGNIGGGLVIGKIPDNSPRGYHWSDPVSIKVAGLGGGFVFGAEKISNIVLLNTPEAVASFYGGNQVSLGGSLSLAVGPTGRDANANIGVTDASSIVPAFSYSVAKGAYIGALLEGAVLTVDKEECRRFYGIPTLNPDDVFAGRVVSTNVRIATFLRDLEAIISLAPVIRRTVVVTNPPPGTTTVVVTNPPPRTVVVTNPPPRTVVVTNPPPRTVVVANPPPRAVTTTTATTAVGATTTTVAGTRTTTTATAAGTTTTGATGATTTGATGATTVAATGATTAGATGATTVAATSAVTATGTRTLTTATATGVATAATTGVTTAAATGATTAAATGATTAAAAGTKTMMPRQGSKLFQETMAAVTPLAPLAQGWQQARDSRGKIYYWNPTTKQTQWDRPVDEAAVPPPLPPAIPHASPTSLPQGWVQIKDPSSGKFYYYNASTKTTQWEVPA